MTIEDIKRWNHIKYTACRELVVNPKPLWKCLVLYILRFPFMLIKGRFGIEEIKEVLFVAPTINNRKSVEKIMNCLPEQSCTYWTDFTKVLPYVGIYLKSILYLHLFFSLYIKSNKNDRRLIRFFYLDFLLACSTYQELDRFLKNNNALKLIIFANDHILENRCLIELSEKYNIKSLYVQHASVSTAFPPLRFDYSFLDGRESYEKYKIVGDMRGLVFLTGSPRFDVFHNYQSADRIYDIGIALNELDSEDRALQLCLYLKNHYSDKIVVRPHPGMLNSNNLRFHQDKFIEKGFAISDPKKDLSYVFISQIKMMVANESGIHLDAALMGVPSMLFNFSDNEVKDWYSYIKTGLIKKCDTFDDVVKMLDNGCHSPIEVVRYYAASFKTTHDGRVGDMIATFVNKLIIKSEIEAFDYIYTEMKQGVEYAEYRK